MQVASAVLLIAAVRTAIWSQPGAAARQAPLAAVETHHPDLATAPWPELALLPGLGAGRAQLLAEQRSRMGPVLRPAAVHLVAGIGQQTASDLSDWYAQMEAPP